MSMYSIRLLTSVTIVLLTACTASVQIDKQLGENDTTTQPVASLITDSERNDYRNAITALNNDKLDIAEKILKEIIDKRNDLAGPWANLGLVYIRKNDLESAIQSLNKALQLNPNQPQALNLLGSIEYNKGNLKTPIDLYLSAIKNKPDYANAHYNLALLYDIYFQDIPKAIEHYKKYLELTDYQDKQTEVWLEQLVSTLKNS